MRTAPVALVPEPEPAPAPAPVIDEKAALRKATADLEGARARVERDAAKVHQETRQKLVAELLPVLDSLDRAIADHTERGEASEGVALIRAQLDRVLRGYGLERFDTEGTPFDPNTQEAVAVVAIDDPKRHGTVVRQWEPGYKIGNRLLRPAKVQVGRYR